MIEKIIDFLQRLFGSIQTKQNNAEVDRQVAQAIKEAQEDIDALDEHRMAKKLEELYRD